MVREILMPLIQLILEVSHASEFLHFKNCLERIDIHVCSVWTDI